MVIRLLLDVMGRKKVAIGFIVLQTYFYTKVAWDIWPATDGVALAMAFAGFLTLLFADAFRQRELYYLPVSRRTWWVASWWVRSAAALITTASVVLAGSAAGRFHSGVDFDGIALMAVSSFLYCGVTLAAQVWFRNFLDRPATALSAIGSLPLLLALIVAPFALSPYLPHAFGAITMTTAIVLAAAGWLTARGYGHHPPIEPRLVGVRQPSASRQKGALQVSAPGATGRASFADRLTGWRLVVWDESCKHLSTFATVIGAVVLFWALASQVRQLPALHVFLGLVDALPLASRAPNVTEPITWGALFFVANLIDSWVLTGMRPLRALPVSSARLASVPVALGLVITAMLFLVMLTLHLLVLNTVPVSLRLDLFGAFAAVTAVSQTIRLLGPGTPAARAILGSAPVGVIWLVLGSLGETWRASDLQWAFLVAAPLMVVISWAVTYRALTHGRRVYRVRPAAIGALAPSR